MAKTDIENAFRLMSVHPRGHELLVFTLQNEMQDSDFYYNTALPQGLTVSSSYFEKFGTAVQWIMETKFRARISLIIYYFFFAGPNNSPLCKGITGHVFKSVQKHGHSDKTRKNSPTLYQYHYLWY